MSLLEARGLDVLLGDYQVLWGARCAVEAGEVVALLGPNGAGKSTLMNAISGLLRPRAGDVVFDGHALTALPPHERVTHGISHVLERRRLFPYLTVRQNVWLGAYHRGARADRDVQYQRMIEMLPVIANRDNQLAATIRRINRDGVTILFIEQNVEMALGIASRGYILESGRTILDGASQDLLHSDEVRRIFLGG